MDSSNPIHSLMPSSLEETMLWSFFLSAPMANGVRRSSIPNFLSPLTHYFNPQLKQTFPGDPQATSAREAVKLTANFHPSILSSHPLISSHPQFQQATSCGFSVLSPPFLINHNFSLLQSSSTLILLEQHRIQQTFLWKPTRQLCERSNWMFK